MLSGFFGRLARTSSLTPLHNLASRKTLSDQLIKLNDLSHIEGAVKKVMLYLYFHAK